MDLYERRQLRYKHILIGIIVCAIVAIVSASTTYYLTTINGVNILKKNSNKNTDSDSTIEAIAESLKSFRTVIDRYYIGEIDEGKLLDYTIKGYVEGLEDE